MDDRLIELVDRASLGDIDAAAEIAEGYIKGSFGKVNYKKAYKWGSYAAKRGHEGAAQTVLKAMEMDSTLTN